MNEWRSVALGDIADIRVSNVDKKSSPGENPVRLCNYMDVYLNEYIRADQSFMESTATASEMARFGLRAGDVLITKDSETPDDIGIPSVIEDDIEGLVCGYHLAMIRPDGQKVDSRYLAKQLALPSTAAYFARRATGSTRVMVFPIAPSPARQFDLDQRPNSNASPKFWLVSTARLNELTR